MIFIQEIPSPQPVTSYMNDICRPLLEQNKIKDEDLRIALFECTTDASDESQSYIRYSSLSPFNDLRSWRADNIRWKTEYGSMVVAVLNTLKKKIKWTPGALSIVIFNMGPSSVLDFKPSTYY